MAIACLAIVLRFAFANMMELLADEFAGLCCGATFTLSCVPVVFLFRHDGLPFNNRELSTWPQRLCQFGLFITLI